MVTKARLRQWNSALAGGTCGRQCKAEASSQLPTVSHPLLVSSIVLLYRAYTPNRRGGEGEEMAAL